MYLVVYTPQLEVLGIVDIINTLVWVRRDTEYGSFELTVNATFNNISILNKNNIIRKDDDFELAYINSVNVKGTEQGEVLKVTGIFYCGILSQRCVLTNTTNLKALIENNLRGIDLLTVQNDVSNITFTNKFVGQNLGECVIALAKAYGFGFKTLLNKMTNLIEFSIYYGVDRSTQQTDNPYVIFSDNYENLLESEYTNSNVGAVNTVYARCKLPAGIEHCVPPTYDIKNGSGTGIFEKYVEVDAITYDVQEILPEGGTVTKIFLDAPATLTKMMSEATNALVQIQENFQGTVDFKLRYKEEYDLGDVVTISNTKWGIGTNQRITEVTEVYDNTSNAVTPTFGNPARTIMDILKKVK